MSRARAAYDDVVVACPVTVPYVRYSIRGAHWFLAGALAQLLKTAGLAKDKLDGLCVSSFTLAPDTAVGLTQHLGLTLRWLDHIPMGGACGVVALRRAARAVQAGDADAVACIAGDTNHTNSFRLNLATFSQFARDAVYPYGSGGAECELRFPHRLLHAYLRRDARGFRQDLRRAARQCAQVSAGADEEAADARRVSRRAPDRRSAAALRLRHAVRRRRRVSGAAPQRGGKTEACPMRASWRRSSGTMPFRTIRSSIAAAGRSIATSFTRRPASGPKTSTCLQTYDDYPVITLMQIEDLGFCDKGEGAGFRAPRELHGTTAPSRSTPPAGNYRSARRARPAAFSAWSRRSDRSPGSRSARKVADARLGLASGFGMINYDRGLCSGAAILAAGNQR